MLKLVVQPVERFNSITNEFYTTKGATIVLEHSLVSLSKWESKWKKPFLSKEKKTPEETIDYIKCMTITQNVDSSVYLGLTDEHIKKVNEYIEDSMTATTFSDKGKPNREIITAELIYYWMIALDIPFECQKWHLNKLMTLIHVCSLKNTPGKKMSKSDLLARNKALNAQRKAKSGTKG